MQPQSSSGHISISADGVIMTTVTPLRSSVEVVVVTIDDFELDELDELDELLLLLDELLLEELLLDELLLDELELLVVTVSRFARSALAPPSHDLAQTHRHCLPISLVEVLLSAESLVEVLLSADPLVEVLLFADPLVEVLLLADPLDELVFVLEDDSLVNIVSVSVVSSVTEVSCVSISDTSIFSTPLTFLQDVSYSTPFTAKPQYFNAIPPGPISTIFAISVGHPALATKGER